MYSRRNDDGIFIPDTRQIHRVPPENIRFIPLKPEKHNNNIVSRIIISHNKMYHPFVCVHHPLPRVCRPSSSSSSSSSFYLRSIPRSGTIYLRRRRRRRLPDVELPDPLQRFRISCAIEFGSFGSIKYSRRASPSSGRFRFRDDRLPPPAPLFLSAAHVLPVRLML